MIRPSSRHSTSVSHPDRPRSSRVLGSGASLSGSVVCVLLSGSVSQTTQQAQKVSGYGSEKISRYEQRKPVKADQRKPVKAEQKSAEKVFSVSLDRHQWGTEQGKSAANVLFLWTVRCFCFWSSRERPAVSGTRRCHRGRCGTHVYEHVCFFDGPGRHTCPCTCLCT